jgi:cytidylate kinase
MSIITISRGLFSSGQALAERVASMLGYRSMSRELLLEAAKRSEIPETTFTELLETSPEVTPIQPEHLRLYRVVMQAAMCEVVQGEKIVYHGHGGQELLPGIQHVLKVRLLAPLSYRVERVREQRKMDQASAYLYIARVDEIRARRVEEFFGIDWQDPRRYDLLLNLAHMSLDEAAQQVAEWGKRPEFQPTPASEQALQDLTVKAHVEAALAVAPETREVNLNVLAKQGTVHIWGTLPGFGLEREVMRVVQSVPGVQEIVPDMRVVLAKVSVGEIH